ncbi:hypothetical protein BX600DRAFT_466319 [Xylariales sp. PMI_506]|nr:hypothetical protein BX600DRAFT_466319 [Xylariales sp. PMI_506]
MSVNWTLLVSRNIYCNYREAEIEHARRYFWKPFNASYFKYAFVRPRFRIEVDNALPNIGPSELEVMGLKEFLQQTAPNVDSALIDQRLSEVTDHLGNAAQQV